MSLFYLSKGWRLALEIESFDLGAISINFWQFNWSKLPEIYPYQSWIEDLDMNWRWGCLILSRIVSEQESLFDDVQSWGDFWFRPIRSLTSCSYLRHPETPASGTTIDSTRTDISRWYLVARGKKINCSRKNGWRSRETDKWQRDEDEYQLRLHRFRGSVNLEINIPLITGARLDSLGVYEGRKTGRTTGWDEEFRWWSRWWWESL